MSRGPQSPKTGKRIFLYMVGVGLILLALIVVLQGFGVLSSIPGFVIWALVLVAIGISILGGIGSVR